MHGTMLPPMMENTAHVVGVVDALLRVQMRTALHDAVRIDILDPGIDP